MSEISRHTEATAIEEGRHLEAGEVEMSLHIANASTLEERQAEVEVVRQKARRSLLMFGILVAVVVLGALGIAGLSARVAAQNGDRIDDLTMQLTEARQSLANAATTDSAAAELNAAIDKCTVVLQTFVRDANRQMVVTTARLSIFLAETPPADRTPELVASVVPLVKAAIGAYELASTRISDWQRLPAVQQLPCPPVTP